MSKNECYQCGDMIHSRYHIVSESHVFCSVECSEQWWRDKGADQWAASEEDYNPQWMTSFEDLMESRGYVCADDHYCERMSDYS